MRCVFIVKILTMLLFIDKFFIYAAFEEAEKNAPAIIFIDELDAIAPKRDKVCIRVHVHVTLHTVLYIHVQCTCTYTCIHVYMYYKVYYTCMTHYIHTHSVHV